MSPDWKHHIYAEEPGTPSASPLLPFDGQDVRAAEYYRMIRTKLLLDPRQFHTFAVTSPQAGDGKSVSAVNIAGALALRNDTRVLLVDADLRMATLHGLLNVPASPGLAEVLSGAAKLEAAILRLDSLAPGLHFLPAGDATPNPVELLDSATWTALCARFRQHFDFVIIDTPPIGVVADYDLVQAHVDGIILILRADHTKRQRCFDSLRAIPGDRLAGGVMNCAPDWFATNTRYDGYHYYKERKA